MQFASIIVLTASSQLEHTKKCLESIEKNTSNYELILIRDDPKFFNFAKNSNRGMRVSTGNYLVLMNDDCFGVPEKWLDKLILRGEQDPRTGIVAPVLHYPSGEPEYVLNTRRDKDGYCVQIPFACVLIKRKLVDDIGYMDESFKYEEQGNEYCARAIRKGWKIAVADDVNLTCILNSSKHALGAPTESSRAFRLVFSL